MRLAERYLPQSVMSRPKQGFSSGLPYLMRTQFASLVRHFLGSSRLVEAGYLRDRPIRDLLSAHLAGRTDHGNRLWLLLHAEIWHRVFLDQISVVGLQNECDELLSGAREIREPGAPVIAV